MTPKITGKTWDQLGVALYLVHELTHVFTQSPNKGAYGHQQMADAAQSAAKIRGIDVEKEIKVSKDKNLVFPSRNKYKTGEEYDAALSEYYNRVLSYACRKVKL